ncbi:MAG TPA: tetratricopeptide repeat protein [Vicinamibacterales bacterium]|nr:tetratricopeptide repeat protein [Vicinamibacterales bacterium]
MIAAGKRRRWLAAASGILLAAAACAPKKLELPPANVAAKYPDYIFPAAVATLGTPAAQERHLAGWQWLQAGDLKAAERNFEAALKLAADFYPAEAGLGYVNLAKNANDSALDHFDRAVVANPRYVPALAGRGEALLALGQRDVALKSFEAAVTADPGLDALRTRIAVLRARGQQDDVAAARKALESGRLDDARSAYERAIVASPDSPFLYRELADVMRREGNLDAAAQQAVKASELDPSDARVHTLLGEIHEARKDLPQAIAEYEASLKLEPNPNLEKKLDALREEAVLAKMPAEFLQIESAPSVSREQLAALVGVRLDDLLRRVQRRTAVVITDTRGSWATPWILAVTRAGVMEVYPNHTFQPSAPVHRGELADAASRILSIIAAEKPAVAAAWRATKRQFSDLSPAHLSYPAASLSVGAGVLQPLPDGSFQLARPVTGAEAVAAVKKLEELAESSVR